MSEIRNTQCPGCHRTNEVNVAPEDTTAVPQDEEDCTLCWECGTIAVFSLASPGGLRLPTEEEMTVIQTNSDLTRYRLAILESATPSEAIIKLGDPTWEPSNLIMEVE